MHLTTHLKTWTAWAVCGALLAGVPALAVAQTKEQAPSAATVPVVAKAGGDVTLGRPEVASLNASQNGVVPTQPVRLKVWGFEVYDARLWIPRSFRHSQYVQHPFALELQYLRRLDGTAIASRSIDEMRRVGTFSDTQAQSWQAAMSNLFPNVAQGDRITGVNQPGQGAEFWVNGQRAGEVKDPAFARLFFGIWLDERTSEPKMRTQLLQGLQP
jgi:hypothetical protein